MAHYIVVSLSDIYIYKYCKKGNIMKKINNICFLALIFLCIKVSAMDRGNGIYNPAKNIESHLRIMGRELDSYELYWPEMLRCLSSANERNAAVTRQSYNRSIEEKRTEIDNLFSALEKRGQLNERHREIKANFIRRLKNLKNTVKACQGARKSDSS